MSLNLLVHLSNILLLVSYSVRDILWLRWLAVGAALVNIPYFLLQDKVLWPPVAWASVLITMNLYQIARIYLARRQVVLSEDEQKLYDLGFHSLRPREFVSLSLAGEWKSAAAGEKFIAEGQPVSSIGIPISGRAEVRCHGMSIGALTPGHIMGTGLAVTGEPSPIDVTFTEPARYMRWSLPSLRKFADARPDLRVTLQSLVSRDLANKLSAVVNEYGNHRH